MAKIRVSFDPFLDDASNPDERIITVHNGISALYPPSDRQEAVLRVRRLHDHHLEFDTLEVSEGVTFRIPKAHLAPEPPVEAHWVNASEGSWLVLDKQDVSSLISPLLKPFLTELVTNIAHFFGRTLVWQNDVDEQRDDLDRPAM
jgi:hypothetical protein